MASRPLSFRLCSPKREAHVDQDTALVKIESRRGIATPSEVYRPRTLSLDLHSWQTSFGKVEAEMITDGEIRNWFGNQASRKDGYEEKGWGREA